MDDVITLGGLQLRFLQSKEATEGSLDLFEVTVLPNARMPVPHYHETWDETVYGLDGITSWRVDGQDVRLAPGETVFIKLGVVHSFSNDTQEPSRCLCILTAGRLGPAFFRDMASLTGAGTPDLTKVKETMLQYGLVPVSSS